MEKLSRQTRPPKTVVEGTKERQNDLFPVQNVRAPIYFGERPEIYEGIVSRYEKPSFGKKYLSYRLIEPIGGLHYFLYLDQLDETTYSLGFKTEEYEYALTNLTEKDRVKLMRTLAKFLESAYKNNPNIKNLTTESADQSYTSQEIDQCIEKILESSKNKLPREELMRDHKGFKIFDLYQEIYGKNFHKIHYNETSRAKGRSRLFKMAARKYWTNWHINEEYSYGNRLVLTRTPESKKALARCEGWDLMTG